MEKLFSSIKDVDDMEANSQGGKVVGENADFHYKLVYYYYANDLKFYHRLLERFNPDGKTWEEISWLKKQ